ncbi:MAG: hypothetical protein ACJASX_001397, partial [Limisphaerales bacterium]
MNCASRQTLDKGIVKNVLQLFRVLVPDQGTGASMLEFPLCRFPKFIELSVPGLKGSNKFAPTH